MVTFLSHFTPSMMPEDVIERIFVQRKRLASRLVTLVRESVLGTAKHHTLIVGPRGIGKTHLASLVYHRVRAIPELADQIRIAWLREEEWGIASFLDFVIRVLRALDEEYPQAGMAAKIDGLFAHKPEQAEREAVALLDEFVGDRTVFLLTENLDQLFEGLNDVGQQQFRAYLQDRASWTILATAPGLFSGISLQSSPFYGFFRVRHLKELSVDEAIELLQKIAELSGREDLASFVSTPVGRARIRAVHHLAGGNHRIYVIFSEFLTRETLDELVDPFLTTMDHLTPYYQARMQSLSPQQRKIVDFLCEIRHAVPVKEIAQRCFITQQTASAQLKLLKERGFVRCFSVGRESYYELMEPLLRLSLEVKKQRGEPIRLFVDFLRYWYTKPELEKRLHTAGTINPMDREYFFRALEEWDSAPLAQDTQIREWEEQLSTRMANGDFHGAMEFAESLAHIRGAPADYLRRADCCFHLEDNEQALICLQEVSKSDPENTWLPVLFAFVYTRMGQFDNAFEMLERPGVAGPSSSYWGLRGDVLAHLGRVNEARVAYETALKLDPDDINQRINLAWFLHESKEFGNVLLVVRDTPDYENNARLLELAGSALNWLGRLDEALEAFTKAIALEETACGRSQLGEVLIGMGRLDEADLSLTRAIELEPSRAASWLWLSRAKRLLNDPEAATNAAVIGANLRSDSYEIQLIAGHELELAGNWIEAIPRYQRAAELRPDDIFLKFRISVGLAASGGWTQALTALSEVMAGPGEITGDFGVGSALSKHWLLARHSSFWRDELAVIASLYSKRGLLPILATAITKSLEVPANTLISPGAVREWVRVWNSLAETYPELELGVRLLTVGVEYHITGDPRHLLELASEERTMVESIPGIRPLSELT
ncbi:MAG TPA: tetratricopeptide repeat protein [Longimicrobium sp.]|jgi:tetratricopeptide (TPR) repeat protein